ncbi:pancreatic triacylglycerol lipase-like isoform X2 [Hyposmocoma kahamanoa]|uniref:pancreatic triacylglycerol lipase-like isoform X2 n=1 Tax=Hyposmocoma kahamanoa TaxID=1477025 RepID=UPI000E6D6A70|nr:pancreatic triacylglycerol lipase-like isoform X2 [Hyposmocoma kahamanoa]
MFFNSDDIEYRLYTRSNPEEPIILDSSAKPAKDSNVTDHLSKVPLKMVTHGWESSADKNAVMNIKNAYLATKDVTVIAVDWSPIAESALYPIVAYQTKDVGAYIGQFLDALSDRYNVNGNQVHLIGHSLGAHVMGRAASTSKLTVNRITGLDPARPFFEVPETSEKLDSTDANFVDVIHTCAGLLGVFNGVGHADYYPNDGIAPQPGCQGLQGYMEACSHSRAHYLYTESIYNPKAFPAYQCADWSDYVRGNCTPSSYLGESANPHALGHFYLQTNQYSPYGRGHEIDKKK